MDYASHSLVKRRCLRKYIVPSTSPILTKSQSLGRRAIRSPTCILSLKVQTCLTQLEIVNGFSLGYDLRKIAVSSSIECRGCCRGCYTNCCVAIRCREKVHFLSTEAYLVATAIPSRFPLPPAQEELLLPVLLASGSLEAQKSLSPEPLSPAGFFRDAQFFMLDLMRVRSCAAGYPGSWPRRL
jgi:hypothetical protein